MELKYYNQGKRQALKNEYKSSNPLGKYLGKKEWTPLAQFKYKIIESLLVNIRLVYFIKLWRYLEVLLING